MHSLAISNGSSDLVAAGGLDGYLRQARAIPLLSAEEEHDLFVQFNKCNDLDAARKIVMSHLRFVAYIAKGYVGYGLPLEDIVQEGNVGLMKSVKRFDASHGVRLATFAVHWIKAEIHEYVLKNWRLVKVATTKAQRKLFFNLRKSKRSLERLNAQEAEMIAKDLNVSPHDVVEMESRLHKNDCYFDESFGDTIHEDDRGSIAKAAYLEDDSQSPDKLHEATQIEQRTATSLIDALESLDERSRDIVTSRWIGEHKTGLKALAKRYGVSMERIRQIEKEAMQKMRGMMPDEINPSFQ